MLGCSLEDVRMDTFPCMLLQCVQLRRRVSAVELLHGRLQVCDQFLAGCKSAGTLT